MNLRDTMSFPGPDSDRQPPHAADQVGSFVAQATPALIAFWRILARGRYWIIGLALLGAVAGWLIGRIQTPMYQAQTTVLIEASKSNVVSIEEVYPGLSSDREHYRTQTQFLKSREVGLRVVRDLNLVSNPLFGGNGKPAGASNAGGDEGAAPGRVAVTRTDRSAAGLKAQPPLATTERDVLTNPREEEVLSRVMAGLDIEPIRQSQLVLVKYTSPDPVLAARIANRVSEAFIQAEMDMRLQVTISANSWLAERVADLKRNLDASEVALAEGREQANIVENRGGAIIGSGQQAESLNNRLAEARARRTLAEQAYNQVRPGVAGRENAPPLIANPSVARARDQVSEAQVAMTAVSGRYGSQHPEYVAAQLKLNAARTNLQQQMDAAVDTIYRDYQLAISGERALQRTMDTARQGALSDSRKEAQVALLEQEVQTNRQIYQTFLSRLKETSAAADVQTPQARIVDQAVAPDRPIAPRKAFLIVILGMLGLVAGVALAVLRNQLDSRVHSVEEAEAALGMPVIATLPRLDKKQQRERGMVTMLDSTSFFSETIRMGAAAIHFALLSGGRRSIAITSAAPSEGKSTVAVNLALALSKGNRVVLVDADLYRPNVHRLLQLASNEKGLTQIMKGESDIGSALQRVPGTRLTVIPSGRRGSKPASVLTPGHLRKLVQKLEENFDVVIVDTPPLEVVSDAMTVTGACARSILVLRSNSTSLSLVRRAVRRLRRIQARPMGFIINGHDFKSAQRYYGEESTYESYAEYTNAPTKSGAAAAESAAAPTKTVRSLA